MCHVQPETRYSQVIGKSDRSNQSGMRRVRGGFDAPTRIGFNAVSFDYVSRVTYSHPILPIPLHLASQQKRNPLYWRVTTISGETRIFNAFSSEWKIRADPAAPTRYCYVDYTIQMEFASALYAAVTSQFFNLLVASIDS